MLKSTLLKSKRRDLLNKSQKRSTSVTYAVRLYKSKPRYYSIAGLIYKSYFDKTILLLGLLFL